MHELLSGQYNISSYNLTLNTLSKSAIVASCENYIPAGQPPSVYFSGYNLTYIYYSEGSESSKAHNNKISMASIAYSLFILIPIAVATMFTNCLKRREDPKGQKVWRCRKAFGKCTWCWSVAREK